MHDAAEGRTVRFGALRDAVGAAVGAVLGLVPHVLHHLGVIAGAAVLTGAGGNAALYVVGLVLSVPMLRRIHRRFRTWLAPAIAVGLFTAMFLVSALVVGPALSDRSPNDERRPAPSPTQQHSQHHS